MEVNIFVNEVNPSICSANNNLCILEWREMKCAAKDEKAQKSASPCEMSLKETEADDKLRTAPFETCFEVIP